MQLYPIGTIAVFFFLMIFLCEIYIMHLYCCCVSLLDWHHEFGSTGKVNTGRISDMEVLRDDASVRLPQILRTAITSDPLIGFKNRSKIRIPSFSSTL